MAIGMSTRHKPTKAVTDRAIEGWLQILAEAKKNLSKPTAELIHPFEEAKQWAIAQTYTEAKELGLDVKKSAKDPEIAAALILRYSAWLHARLQWYIYAGGRWLPGWRAPINKMYDEAVVAGKLLHDPATADDPRVTKFIRNAQKHKPEVWARFLREAAEPKWIKSKHPELDEWLILIWPLVDSQGWTCTEVLNIAEKKFPALAGKYPLSSSEDLGKHIRKSVNKHFRVDDKTPSFGLKLPAAGKRSTGKPLLPLHHHLASDIQN